MMRTHRRRHTVTDGAAQDDDADSSPDAGDAVGSGAPDQDQAATLLRLLLHDFRAPIEGALSSATGLRDEPGAAHSDQVLDRLVGDLTYVHSVLVELVDMERRASSPARLSNDRPIDARQLVQQVLQRVDTSGRNVRVKLNVRVVRGDPATIGRVLGKLVGNAVNHTPIDANVWIRSYRHAHSVRFVVEDDGPGVPDPVKQRIFEPWDRGIAPDERPGLGLGLALARRLTEQWCGQLWVEDRPGGGARFVLELPAASPSHAAVAHEAGATEGARQRRSKPSVPGRLSPRVLT